MRDFSSDFVSEIQAQQTGEVFLTLLELSYDGASTLYFVNNQTDVTYGTQTYTAFPFIFTMPQESDSVQSTTLTLDNVDRSIALFVLAAGNTNIAVVARLYHASTSTVEMSQSFILTKATITRNTVSGQLSYVDYRYDAFPSLKKTPSKFPGIY